MNNQETKFDPMTGAPIVVAKKKKIHPVAKVFMIIGIVIASILLFLGGLVVFYVVKDGGTKTSNNNQWLNVSDTTLTEGKFLIKNTDGKIYFGSYSKNLYNVNPYLFAEEKNMPGFYTTTKYEKSDKTTLELQTKIENVSQVKVFKDEMFTNPTLEAGKTYVVKTVNNQLFECSYQKGGWYSEKFYEPTSSIVKEKFYSEVQSWMEFPTE